MKEGGPEAGNQRSNSSFTGTTSRHVHLPGRAGIWRTQCKVRATWPAINGYLPGLLGEMRGLACG